MALQVLFEADINNELPEALRFFEHHNVPERIRDFTERIVTGVNANRDEIDRALTQHSSRWPLERMGVVDRNVLRIAVFELLHEAHTPGKVVIDEAIEIAKKYGSSESHAFINGVLDSVRKSVREGVTGCGAKA